MRVKKGFTLVELIMVCFWLIMAMGLVGYITNIVKFCHCDFKAPVKAEVCRGIGILMPPVGAVEGFITIKDGTK